LPVVLVYLCELASENEVFLRERQIKGWSRRKKEALIHSDFDALVEFSKTRSISRDGVLLHKVDNHPEPVEG
jgi:putative endonuclease